jgi:hypothetical protein
MSTCAASASGKRLSIFILFRGKMLYFCVLVKDILRISNSNYSLKMPRKPVIMFLRFLWAPEIGRCLFWNDKKFTVRAGREGGRV